MFGDAQSLGLVDGRGGLAVLRHPWTRVDPVGVVGAEHYGDPGSAEHDLRRLVDGWRALGRPRLADFEVRVAFGRPPRGAMWRLPSGGGARIGVSVRRPSG
jgi:hypothetical protein